MTLMIGTNSPEIQDALEVARHRELHNVSHVEGPVRNIHTLPLGALFRYHRGVVPWRITRASYISRHGRAVDAIPAHWLSSTRRPSKPIGSSLSSCNKLTVILLRDFADEYTI